MMMEVMILIIMVVVMIALDVAIMPLVVHHHHIDVESFHHGPLIDWFGYWSSPDENSITLTLYF